VEAMLDCIAQGGNSSMLAWHAAMDSIRATMAEHGVERI
jgi:hypothetical protein